MFLIFLRQFSEEYFTVFNIEKTYQGKVLLDLISENELYDLFNNNQISLIIGEMWKGEYQTYTL